MTRSGRHRPTCIAMYVVGVAIGALAFTPSSQAKEVVDAFGLPGTQGGRLTASGIAINQTGAGGVAPGTLYVSDKGPNVSEAALRSNRIQRFDPEGHFERLWGFNVVGPNEVQNVAFAFAEKGDTLANEVGGSFSLSFEGDTAEFPVGASAVDNSLTPLRATLQSGLEALPAIGAGNVRVRGGIGLDAGAGAYEVEFVGPLGGTDVGELVLDASDVVPGPTSASVSTVRNGSGGPYAGFEICTAAVECRQGEAVTGSGGEVGMPAGIAVNQSTGDVYAIDWTNHRIDEFDADGTFIRAFGRDVVSAGGSGDVSTEAYEVCEAAADCKAGLVNGEAGSVTFGRDVAIDSAGHVWLANAGNRRIEEFDKGGSFIAAYGWNVDPLGGSGELEKCTSTAVGACQAAAEGTQLGQFKESPEYLTIGPSGFLYAPDRGNNRIQRLDPATLSATLFAANLGAETGLSQIVSSEDGIEALPDGHVLLGVDESSGDRLLDLDGAGQLTETSLAGDGVPALEHLALNEATGAIYATVPTADGAPGVAVIDDGPASAPAVTIAPPSELGAESATFNATVDPGGALVADCGFEYSTDQVSWELPPVSDCGDLDPDGGSQPIGEPVTGLEPQTPYFVRFKAGRFYNHNPWAAATSAEEAFTTPASPPIVSDVGAGRLTDTSAYLAGEIEPRSQSYEFHFEYGTTPALGISTPTVGVSGSKKRVVSQRITGLEPGTTYFVKLVAENVAATTESPSVGFATRPSGPGPEGRAYEQVTPPDKNFSNADYALDAGVVAADGDATAVCMTSGFGEPAGQVSSVCTTYRSSRHADGWHTRWYGEPSCSADETETAEIAYFGSEVEGFSQDLDLAVIGHVESSSCPYPPLDPAAPMPQRNLYRADYRGASIGYDLLAPQPGFAKGLIYPTGRYEAGSDDLSHVVYSSAAKQTTDAPAGAFEKLYDWHEGTLSLVSRDPSGTRFTTSTTVPEDALGGVSADGARIFFMTPEGATREIYMRQDATVTYDVSESECTSECGESAADEFLAATPTGAQVALMSKAKLTDGDEAGNGNDLYLYAHGANPAASQNLTLLSKDSEPADGSGARVLGLLGMGEDGEAVYFVAASQLVEGAPTGTGPKAYRWQAGEGVPSLEYLGTLSTEDRSNWARYGVRGDTREVTADGARLLIHTAVRLNRGADHDSDVDVYRWDEQDGWLCISCQIPAAPSAGGSTFEGLVTSLRGSFPVYRNAMSADGGRVFFATADPLVPGDPNERDDVYEWDENGAIALISSGTDVHDVRLLGVGASGRDVFFTTYERLVGWDTDDNSDLYDARVGGGFPEPPPVVTACEGAEACHGGASRAPVGPGAGSAVFEGRPSGDGRSCRALARRARLLSRRAERLGRRADRIRDASKGRQLRLRANRLTRLARRLGEDARRCSRAGKGRAGR